MGGKKVLALDPGPVVSGAVLVRLREHYPPLLLQKWTGDDTGAMLKRFKTIPRDVLAIEMIASYGMPVGAEVFETCVWIGRFLESSTSPVERITRNKVKNLICHSSRAKDANIRRAILDMYPATGGGKTPQIGTKKQPGPLCGMAKHAWPALALAIAYQRISG